MEYCEILFKREKKKYEELTGTKNIISFEEIYKKAEGDMRMASSYYKIENNKRNFDAQLEYDIKNFFRIAIEHYIKEKENQELKAYMKQWKQNMKNNGKYELKNIDENKGIFSNYPEMNPK